MREEWAAAGLSLLVTRFGGPAVWCGRLQVQDHLETTKEPHFTAPLGVRRHLPLFIFLPGLDGTVRILPLPLFTSSVHLDGATLASMEATNPEDSVIQRYCERPCYDTL